MFEQQESCYTCQTPQNNDLKVIFTDIKSKDVDDFSFLDKLKLVFPVQLCEENQMLLCPQCVYQLLTSYNFIQTVIQTQTKLRNRLGAEQTHLKFYWRKFPFLVNVKDEETFPFGSLEDFTMHSDNSDEYILAALKPSLPLEGSNKKPTKCKKARNFDNKTKKNISTQRKLRSRTQRRAKLKSFINSEQHVLEDIDEQLTYLELKRIDVNTKQNESSFEQKELDIKPVHDSLIIKNVTDEKLTDLNVVLNKFECDECNKIFSSSTELRIHDCDLNELNNSGSADNRSSVYETQSKVNKQIKGNRQLKNKNRVGGKTKLVGKKQAVGKNQSHGKNQSESKNQSGGKNQSVGENQSLDENKSVDENQVKDENYSDGENFSEDENHSVDENYSEDEYYLKDENHSADHSKNENRSKGENHLHGENYSEDENSENENHSENEIHSESENQSDKPTNTDKKLIKKSPRKRKSASNYDPLQFQCPHCEQPFEKQWILRKHINRVHRQEKNYICTFCNRGFKQSYHLREHITSHTGEKNYHCNVCGKSFQRISSQKRHLRSHDAIPGQKTKRTPFLCTICGKSFPFSNGVQRHMRTHFGIKTHECIICNRKFTQSTHLHVHMRIHTGEKPYICDACGAAFALNASLAKHKLTHRAKTPPLKEDITMAGSFVNSEMMQMQQQQTQNLL